MTIAGNKSHNVVAMEMIAVVMARGNNGDNGVWGGSNNNDNGVWDANKWCDGSVTDVKF